MEIGFTRSERGGICPDCGDYMQPGEVNNHMQQHVAEQQFNRSHRLEDLISFHQNPDGSLTIVPRLYPS